MTEFQYNKKYKLIKMELIHTLYKLKKSVKTKRTDDQVYASKLTQFEEILEADDNLSEQQANLLLYGKTNITTTFRSLKYRMEEKLMNDIFLLLSSERNLDSRVNAVLNVEKMALIALALSKHANRKKGIVLTEKAINLSKKYSYTDITLKLLLSLMNYYSFVEPNPRKMQSIMDEVDHYTELFNAEIYVRKCNAIISHMDAMNKGGMSTLQLKIIKEMVDKMQEIKSKYSSNTIIFFVHDLTYFYYQVSGNYKKGLEVATLALEEISALKNIEVLGIYGCSINIAVSYFYLKNYLEASIWFEKILQMITPGSRNWFYTNGLYFLTIISMRNYEELLKMTLLVTQNKNIIKFPYFSEQWSIREAYVYFLIKIDKIDLSTFNNENIKHFSISKFLNSVPFHSKDKSGQNITIIVIQILFFLSDRKYNKIIDRIDALSQYTYRYLRKDESFRSNCFIKMLLLMIKADFHPVRTNTYTSELRIKLNNSHLIMNEKSTQVEIIPYEYLWEFILEILEKNK